MNHPVPRKHINMQYYYYYIVNCKVSSKIFFMLDNLCFFIFNKCPVYTHDGANAKFSTNSYKKDYSVAPVADRLHCNPFRLN
jgi:hypothetical protein